MNSDNNNTNPSSTKKRDSPGDAEKCAPIAKKPVIDKRKKSSSTNGDAKKPAPNSVDAGDGRADPVGCLPDSCLSLVFSFVGVDTNDAESTDGSGESEGLSIYALQDFVVAFSRVSPEWKQMIWRILSSLPIKMSADFTIVGSADYKAMFARFLIGTCFPLRSVGWNSTDDHEVASRLLREGDTSALKHARVPLRLASNTPTATYRSQRIAHDAVATECPKLDSVHLGLFVGANGPMEDRLYSQALFSHASITQVGITVMLEEDVKIHRSLIAQCIENLPSLELLCLGSKDKMPCATDVSDDSLPIIQISSPSLQFLDVQRFFQRTKLALKCPRLSSFRCAGERIIDGRNGALVGMLVKQRVVEAKDIPTNCEGIVWHGNGGASHGPFAMLLHVAFPPREQDEAR